MKKIEKYFSIIYILGVFLIPICIVLLIYYTFVGKSYYNINSKNFTSPPFKIINK